MMLTVIKNSKNGDPTPRRLAHGEFTAHGNGRNYFIRKMMLTVIKNSPNGDRTPWRLAHGEFPLTGMEGIILLGNKFLLLFVSFC
jgi:hypothetical protein